MTKRHLHLDYHTSYCGKDISHLLATYDEAECSCKACLKQIPVLAAAREAEARRAEEEERARQERVRVDEERARQRMLAAQDDEAKSAAAWNERLRRLERAVGGAAEDQHGAS
jgi:hypothetical protein